MDLFEQLVMGGAPPPSNFIVIALMVMKFGVDVKLFYTMVEKICDVTTIT